MRPVGRAALVIDGIDGSGKSMLTARLAAAVRAAGVGAVVLAVDDFRRPVDWQLAGSGQRTEADLYYDDYYDLPLLDRCLNAFITGDPFVDIPVFDAASYRLDGQRRISFEGANLALLEGVFALRIPSAAANAAVIYLRTSFAAAERRVVARDTARGRSADDVNHRIHARYFPAQERYLAACDPVARADVLIDNEDWRSPSLLRNDADALRSKLGRSAGDDLTSLLSDVLSGVLGDFASSRTVG
ncbi:MAG: hypothetical protein ABIS92_04790 [Polyangia bacterium]